MYGSESISYRVRVLWEESAPWNAYFPRSCCTSVRGGWSGKTVRARLFLLPWGFVNFWLDMALLNSLFRVCLLSPFVYFFFIYEDCLMLLHKIRNNSSSLLLPKATALFPFCSHHQVSACMCFNRAASGWRECSSSPEFPFLQQPTLGTLSLLWVRGGQLLLHPFTYLYSRK